jgi:hypothetical protein
MYLFTRTARLAQGGRITDRFAGAVELTEAVRRTTGLEVGLHALQFSAGLGTIVWSAIVPDLPTLERANDALMADAAYLDLLEARGGTFADGIDDALWQIVQGVPDPDRSAEYVAVVQTICAPGQMQRGVELGLEIAQKAEAISGQPTWFCLGVTGPFGAVAWLTGYPDAQALQDGEAATYADPAMLDLIDHEAAKAYTSDPQSSGTSVYRRVL